MTAAEPRRPRRLGRILLGFVGIAVVALVVLVVLVVRGRDAGRVSVDEALERYHETTTVAGPALGRPAQGVYTLTGSGSEKLSFQTGSQTIGPTLPATVTWQEGDCWEFRVDFNANHWQAWVYCHEGDRVVERGGSVFQRFDLVIAQPESSAVTVCDPPVPTVQHGAAVGTTWDESCVVTTEGEGSSETTGPVSFLGVENVTVAGEQVQAGRYRSERDYSGAQRGSGEFETWYATDSGLPLRARWGLELTSGSPVGDVTYTESGEWTIDSLVPRR